MTPIRLSRPIECTYPGWVCPHCGREIRTERSPRTGWREQWYTVGDNRRHHKTHCNIMEDAFAAFRRMTEAIA